MIERLGRISTAVLATPIDASHDKWVPCRILAGPTRANQYEVSPFPPYNPAPRWVDFRFIQLVD